MIGWKPFRAARPVGQDHCFVRAAARFASTRVTHPSFLGAAPSPRCALRPPFFLESESAKARTLFRKQLDRHCRLRRKTSALRQFPRVAQKQSNRPITDRPRSVTVHEDQFGGLIPEAGSRGANACGDSVAEGRNLNPPPLPGRLRVGQRSLTERSGDGSTKGRPRRASVSESNRECMCGSAAARPGRRRQSPQGRARSARANHAPAANFILCKHW